MADLFNSESFQKYYNKGDEAMRGMMDDIYSSNPLDGERPVAIEDRPELRGMYEAFDAYKPKELDFSAPIIDPNDMYTTLNDGSRVAKYDNFLYGVDNEERLATQQSGWEQTLNGMSKATLKTGLNIIDGTVGTVVGLVNGIKEGSLSAMYNNDFAKFMDDQNTKLDYKLPNYYTQEQKNMGFLESTGTANFWANDVMGGISFMAGTIGSEAIWAAATGGGSLTTIPTRMALKAAAKASMKAVAKSTVKNTVTASMKAFLRGAKNVSKTKMINNARFLYTSAAYESGIEARHSLNESLESFVSSYESTMGRSPNPEEYNAFFKEAVDNSNIVFGANVGLVGASNIAQFGGYFGIKTGLSKSISKATGRMFGVGVTDIAKKTAKPVYKALTSNKLQRIAGTTLALVERPITEGVFEEGMQAVISGTSKNWLAAKFNAGATKENYGLADAAYSSFAHTYGTKEGWKEIGIGGIIGLLGGARSRNVKGELSPFGITDYSAKVALNQEIVDAKNTSVKKLSSSVYEFMDKFQLANQHSEAVKKASKENRESNISGAAMHMDSADFTKFLMDDSSGMFNEVSEDFKRVIEDIPSEEIMQQYGIDENGVQEMKSAILGDFDANAKSFAQAKKIAQSIVPDGFSLKGQTRDYTHELAHNIYLGEKAYSRALEFGEAIDESVGQGGYADALKIYANISKRARTAHKAVGNLQEEVDGLQAEFTALQQTLPLDIQNLQISEEQAQGLTAEKKKNRKDFLRLDAKLNKKRQKLEAEKAKLQGTKFVSNKYSFGNVIKGNEFSEVISVEEIDGAIEKIKELDKFRELLGSEKSTAMHADKLDFLLGEYTKNMHAHKSFNENFERMSQPKFLESQYTGILKTFKTGDIENKELAEYLEEHNVSDYDAYVFSELDKSLRLTQSEEGRDSIIPTTENIENEDWNRYTDEGILSEEISNVIVAKLKDEVELSKRESKIYQDQKESFDEKVKEGDTVQGDGIASAAKKTKKSIAGVTNTDIIEQRIKRKLAQIKEMEDTAAEGTEAQVDGNIEAKKADIESRREEELNYTINSKEIVEGLGLEELSEVNTNVQFSNKEGAITTEHGEAQGVRTKYNDGVLRGTSSITLNKEATLEVLIHELLHEFFNGKNSTERAEAFSKSIFKTLGKVAKEGSWMSRVSAAYGKASYKHSAEELAILYLTSKEFRDNLPKSIASKVELWLVENNIVTKSQFDKFTNTDLTTKVKDVINAKYDAELTALNEKTTQTPEVRTYEFDELKDEEAPTSKDIKEFLKLDAKIKDGKYTPKQKKRHVELYNKIKIWGELAGDTKSNLAEDLILLQQIEGQKLEEQDESVITKLWGEVLNLLPFSTKKGVDKKGYEDHTLTWDKSTFNYNPVRKSFSIQGINMNRLMELADDKDSSVVLYKTVKNKKVEVSKVSGVWDIEAPKVGEIFHLQYQDSFIPVIIGTENNLEVNELLINDLEAKTGIILKSMRGVPSNYSTTMVNLNGVNVPLDSNFEFEEGKKMDIGAAQKVRVGDELTLDMPTGEDSYNHKLLQNYKKAKAKAKGDLAAEEKAFNEIMENAVIYMTTKDNKFVAVGKALRSSNQTNLYKLRYLAALHLVNTNYSEGEIVNINMNGKVASMYIGKPNLLTNENGIMNIPLDDKSKEKMIDFGYIENNELKVKGKTKNIDTFQFTAPLMDKKNKNYVGVRQPVAILEVNGKTVAYPITLVPQEVDIIGEIERITSDESAMKNQDKITELNSLLETNGIDLNEFGIRVDNFNKGHISKVKREVKSKRITPNVSEWVSDKAISMDLIKGTVRINVDLNNKPFHSPKIVLDLPNTMVKHAGKWSKLSEIDITEFPVTYPGSTPTGSQAQINSQQNKDC